LCWVVSAKQEVEEDLVIGSGAPSWRNARRKGN
jgi:hypothetical protein